MMLISFFQLDLEPRLEASWMVGGMNPPQSVKRNRKKHPFFRKMTDEPLDRHFGYIGHPILSSR